jgi:hypothetical protein
MIVFKYILMAILVFALIMLLAIPIFLVYKMIEDD